MSHIIQISDFKGFFDIATNSRAESKFQSFIDGFENGYLTDLMGLTLKDVFVNNLVNGKPTSTTYLEFFDPFEIDINGDSYISKGLKACLMGLIYYHFLTDDNTSHSLTGLIVNSNENSEVVNPINTERKAEKRWNEFVETYNLISYKIVELGLYDNYSQLDTKFLDLV